MNTNERDYNFRYANKLKEQERRAFIHKTHYFPTTPKQYKGENGEFYYTEGSVDKRKQSLKRVANKKVRQSDLDGVGNGRHYKKLFDLPWNWY